MESTTSQKSKPVEVQTQLATRHPLRVWAEAVLRRVIDVVVAMAGLMLLSPTFVLIALAIKRDSVGPIFYRGKRMGRNGREFGILKFRTMYEENAGAGEVNGNGSKVTAQDDPRITPVGKWLRSTKINELPQLWNVVVGEMSLVGPRPEDPDIVRGWPKEYQELLLSVRPGITSPATVIYHDEETLLSTDDVMDDYLKEILPTKMRLDKLYIRNRTITTDLDVLFWTAVALVPRMNRLNVPQHYLYWGPFSRVFGRFVTWFSIDTVIAFMAVTTAGIVWRLSGPLDVGVGLALLYAIGISVLFSCTNWAFKLNRVEWSCAPAYYAFVLGISTVLATLAVIVVDALNPFAPPLHVPVIITAAALALAGFIVARYRERLVTGSASRWLRSRNGVRGMGERVLIVGAGENSGLADWIFSRSTLGKAASVVGIVDDDPRKQGLRVYGHEVMGTTSSILELVRKHDIGLIFYTIENIQPPQRARILSLCHKAGVKVVVLPDLLQVLRDQIGIAYPQKSAERPVNPEKDAEILMDEIQSLLVEYKVEEAQRRLTEFRRQYLPKNDEYSSQ